MSRNSNLDLNLNTSPFNNFLSLTEHINGWFEKIQVQPSQTQPKSLIGFDTTYLLYKLHSNKTPNNTPTAIYKLIKSYLSARCFKVRISETTSETRQILTQEYLEVQKFRLLLFNLYVSVFRATNNTDVVLRLETGIFMLLGTYFLLRVCNSNWIRRFLDDSFTYELIYKHF